MNLILRLAMLGVYLVIAVGVVQVGLLIAYPTRLPLEVCSNGLRPGPPHGDLVQMGNGGFTIATDLPLHSNGSFQYEAGKTYTGKLSCTYTLLVTCGHTADMVRPVRPWPCWCFQVYCFVHATCQLWAWWHLSSHDYNYWS